MIAQDVYNVFDDAVDIRSSTYMNNEGNIEIPDVYSIRYNVILSYLISAFNQKTGLPVLLNTSFNGPDEPIVETPEHALKTFLRRNMYALVINNYLITRK